MKQSVFRRLNIYNYISTIINLTIFGHILGLLAIVFIAFTFYYNKRKAIIFFKILSDLALTGHYFMIGALSGSLMIFISLFRNIVFYFKNDSKFLNKNYILYFFLFIYLVSSLVLWENIYSIFPLLGSFLGAIGTWVKKPEKIRFIYFFASSSWLAYDIIVGSIAGMLLEGIFLTTLLVAVFRFDRENILKFFHKH